MTDRNCGRAGATVFRPWLEKGARVEQEDGRSRGRVGPAPVVAARVRGVVGEVRAGGGRCVDRRRLAARAGQGCVLVYATVRRRLPMPVPYACSLRLPARLHGTGIDDVL